MLYSFVSADRRATARTTTSLSHAAIRQKKDADDWLNFMLSQKNLWPTFTTRGTLTEEISEQTFPKERRRLQAKHLWMEVRLSWHVLAGRMYTSAPTWEVT